MTTPLAVAPDPLAGLPDLMRWHLKRAKPDDDALALVKPGATAEALYDAWMKQEWHPSAIRLIAAVLPARESVWWAWVSARHATQMTGGTAPSEDVHRALNAIEQWIVRPDDNARRAVWDAGNAAGMDTPVGMVCAAVFLNGASIAPPNIPAVPPPPGAALPLISGVIVLAASSNTDAKQVPPTLAAFAAQGLEIIKRVGGWEQATKLAFDTLQRAQQEYARVTQSPTGR
jgi:hypothetical protein